MMQNRIAYYILSLLYLEGKVRIPGVGKLEHRDAQARIDPSGQSIEPPQKQSNFVADQRSKSRLLERFIAYKAQTSRSKARREIARFSEHLKTRIEQEGQFEIGQYGILEEKPEGIVFISNQALLNPGSHLSPVALPERLTPEEHDVHDTHAYAAGDHTHPHVGPMIAEQHDENPEPVDEPHGLPASESLDVVTHDEAIAPYVDEPLIQEESVSDDVAAPVSIPFSFREVAEEEKVTWEEPQQKEEPVVVIPPKIEIEEPKKETGVVVQEKKEKQKTEPAEEKDGIPILLPIAGLILLGLLVGAFLFYQSRVQNRETAVVPDTTEITDPVIGSDIPVTPDTTTSSTHVPADTFGVTSPVVTDGTTTTEEIPADVTSPVVNETHEQPVEESTEQTPSVDARQFQIATGECLIVLGSFSKASNRERMMERLQAMGYTTATQPRGDLTQVAIPVDCKASNLNLVLSFLRQNIEQQAWVLRPQ